MKPTGLKPSARGKRERSFRVHTAATDTPMKSSKHSPEHRPLTIGEVRIVSDLRIMHAKVDDLFHLVEQLRQRYDEAAVNIYSDKRLLSEDIERVDDIYLWFVKLREERDRRAR